MGREKKIKAGIRGPDGQGKIVSAGIPGPDGPTNTFFKTGIHCPDGLRGKKKLKAGIRSPDGRISNKKNSMQISTAPLGKGDGKTGIRSPDGQNIEIE